VGESRIPERPSQLPEGSDFLRYSPDGHPLWLNPEAGQYGIVFIDLPGELRHATAAELQIVRKSQVPRPYKPSSRRSTSTKKEATVPKRKPPAKARGGKPSTAKSGGGGGSTTSWRELEGQELGEYLLGHPTISDKLHTTKSRRKGENRESFIRRVYGLEGE